MYILLKFQNYYFSVTGKPRDKLFTEVDINRNLLYKLFYLVRKNIQYNDYNTICYCISNEIVGKFVFLSPQLHESLIFYNFTKYVIINI